MTLSSGFPLSQSWEVSIQFQAIALLYSSDSGLPIRYAPTAADLSSPGFGVSCFDRLPTSIGLWTTLYVSWQRRSSSDVFVRALDGASVRPRHVRRFLRIYPKTSSPACSSTV